MAGDLPAARADAEASIALAARSRRPRRPRPRLRRVAPGGELDRRRSPPPPPRRASRSRSSSRPGTCSGWRRSTSSQALAHLATDPQACVDISARGLRRLPAGELWATSYLLGQLVIARFRVGDYQAAAESAGKALAMKLQLGDTVGIAHGLRVLGFLAGAPGPLRAGRGAAGRRHPAVGAARLPLRRHPLAGGAGPRDRPGGDRQPRRGQVRAAAGRRRGAAAG